MQLVVSTLTFLAFAASPALAAPAEALPAPRHPELQVAQAGQVEQICVDAINSSGYRVENILSTNTFSGGAEVIMEVRERGGSSVVGCDYSDNTGRIELYQLEESGYSYGNDPYNDPYDDRYSDRYDNRNANCDSSRYGDCYDDRYDNDNGYDDRYSDRYDGRYDDRYEDWQEDSGSSDVRSEGDAEYIARGVVGDQLGIRDPYSDVVQIEDVHRESQQRNWIVEGSVNGAPFVVRIRSSDAYVLDFELH